MFLLALTVVIVKPRQLQSPPLAGQHPAPAPMGKAVLDCGPRPASYVENLKPGGRVHRVAAQSQRLPRSKRVTQCGWRYGAVRTLICSFNRLDDSSRKCAKCFPWRDAARAEPWERYSGVAKDPIIHDEVERWAPRKSGFGLVEKGRFESERQR